MAPARIVVMAAETWRATPEQELIDVMAAWQHTFDDFQTMLARRARCSCDYESSACS